MVQLNTETHEHPAVTGGLDLTYGSDDDYPGLDRFDRVIDQLWETTSHTVKDRFGYGNDGVGETDIWGYDARGNRLFKENTYGITESNKHSELYHADTTGTYDGLSRLTDFRRGQLDSDCDAIGSNLQRDQAFTYDTLGNWTNFDEDSDGNGTDDLTQVRLHNIANEIDNNDDHTDRSDSTITEGVGTPWPTPWYDAVGNMTKCPKPGDEGNSLTLTYDAWNRVVEISSTYNFYYDYDGLNRLIRRNINDEALQDLYYNTSWQLLEIQRTLATTLTWQQFVWDQRYIDAPILRDRDTSGTPDGTLDQRLFYTTDANFNVTALIEPDGDVAERYEYDAYGQVHLLEDDFTDRTSSAYWNEIHFAGYFRDRFSGLYFVRNRIYHPTLGRWLQRDPIGYVDGMSLYEYVKSDPASSTDPLGLMDYHIGRVNPEVARDAGAGTWNSEEKTFKVWYVKQGIQAQLPAVGLLLPNAAAHLRHYFGNTGKTYWIDIDGMVRDVRSVNNVYKKELRLAKAFAETLKKEGEYHIMSGTTTEGYAGDDESKDWYYAVGSYDAWGSGTVTVACDDQGNYTYDMYFRFQVFDRYNWDTGKHVQILGWPVTDKFMGLFHLQGRAREFDMRGRMGEQVKWPKATAGGAEKPESNQSSSGRPTAPASAGGAEEPEPNQSGSPGGR